MNVLMLTSRMDIGGAESHVLTLSGALVRLGHRVIVASAGGRSVPALEESGARHVTLPLDKKDPASVYLARSGILRLCERFSPDVVHSHSRIPSFIYGELTGEGSRIPLVTTVHMPFSYDPLTEWGDAQIAVSRDLAAYLEEKYAIHARTVTVIENGVDTEALAAATRARSAVRARFSIPEDALVISCATRSSVSRARAALYLAKSARRFLRSDEYILLCISGGVGREQDLTQEIRLAADRANATLGRRAVILIEGESDVSRYVAASDVFVGVSRAAIEAMGCGIPVVIAGNEGVGGILTPESEQTLRGTNLTGRGCSHDLGAVAEALDELRDPALRQRLGSFSLAVAHREYSAREMAERTLAVYREAVRPSLLVIGHYGASNRGDDAAQTVLRSHLSDRHSLRFITKSTEACEGGISRFDARRIWRAARRADAVIFGTGNLIQDETSLRSIAYYRAVVALCKRANPRLAVFANGIGPISRPASVRMAREILGSAEYISLRDPDSLELCRMLGTHADSAEPRLGADTVLLLDIEGEARRRSDSFVICPRRGQSERDTAALRSFAARQRKRGLTPIFIPMDEAEDTPLCIELAEDHPESVTVGEDARGIARIMSRARFTVGGRLHAAVLSAMADTPFVCYDSDGRIASFCKYSECGEYLPSGSFSPEALASALDSESARHAARGYSDRISRLRALAREDIARLTEWIKKESP